MKSHPGEHPILYLDFDGVLHPDEVYLIDGQPSLCRPQDPSLKLFCWMPSLTQALEEFPDVRIILSTSWVRMLDFDASRAFLCSALQTRVIGATWHSRMKAGGAWSMPQDPFDNLTRFQQIDSHVIRHGVERWLAVDDDTKGWPEEKRPNLIETDSKRGLGDPETLRRFSEALGRMMQVGL